MGFPQGKTRRLDTRRVGVAAAVFTIFLAMVDHRSEMRDERWKREREERRNRLDRKP